jgi:site-specific recombinase XerD
MKAAGHAPSGERFYLPEDPLIGDFVADLLRKNRSSRTMEAYTRDLERFGRFIAGADDESTARLFPRLRDASASDIRKYVLHLMMVRRYRVIAVRRNLSALRTFFTYLRREGIRSDQPALDVELPKAEQRKPKVLRLPEVAAMIKTRVERPGGTSLAPRDRAIIELLYGSGIRRAELAGLNLDDVDLGARVAMVTGKGNKRRMVPLTEAAVMAMRSYLHVRPASNDRAFFLSNSGRS